MKLKATELPGTRGIKNASRARSRAARALTFATLALAAVLALWRGVVPAGTGTAAANAHTPLLNALGAAEDGYTANAIGMEGVPVVPRVPQGSRAGASNAHVPLDSCGVLDFSGPYNFGAGTTPFSAVAADLDGDGKPDLAVTNYSSNNVSVLRNTSTSGVASFALVTNYGLGTTPSSIIAADFDGDGKMDLAVVNSGSGTISVLRNTSSTGSISFAPVSNYGGYIYPSSITAADFDGDGKPDLAVADVGNSNVSVLRNTSTTGSISFGAASSYSVGTFPSSITAADIDGDGKLDLAVANESSGDVSVLLNTSTPGAVSFAAASSYPTSFGPISITAADLDGDGKPDLAVADNATGVVVLLNTSTPGAVSFAAVANFSADLYPTSVTAADFDGDGKPDLAVANSGSNDVSVLRNTSTIGTLSFAPASNYGAGSGPNSVTAADFDGDGKLDLAVANSGGNNVSVLLNTCAPAPVATVTSTPTKTSTATQTSTATSTNIFSSTATRTATPSSTFTPSNTATQSSTATQTSTSTATHIPGTSCGVLDFSSPYNFGADQNPISITAADIDGDGKLDLITANEYGGSVSVLRNTGAGGSVSFASAINYSAGTHPVSVIAADIDGDGKPDLITANYSDNTVSVLHNTSTSGSISFDPASNSSVGSYPYSVTAADIDGDGKLDLATSNYNDNNVSVLRNTSAGGSISFAPITNFSVGTNPFSITAADVDSDGKVDLATVDLNSNNVSVLRNTSTSGNVSFASAVDFGVGTNPRSIAAADVDGDGKVDLATANGGSNNVSVLRNTSTSGNVSFDPALNYSIGSTPASVTAADLDEDGKPDLVTPNAANNITVLRNTSTSGSISFAPVTNYVVGTNPRSVTAANLNSDGRTDLATANFDSNNVSVLLNTCAPAPTATSTHTATPTLTLTSTSTRTGTGTATTTPTTTNTTTATGTSTSTTTSTGTSSPTGTATRTATPSWTVTQTSTSTASASATPSSTNAATRTATATYTLVSTSTATGTPTRTSTSTSTYTPTDTATPSATSTSTSTTVPSTTSTITRTPSPTQTGQVLPGTQSPSAVPSTATATATTCVINYTDVRPYDPFYRYIQCLTCRGIVSGFADGTFHPNDPITRGQASKMIANAADFEEAVSGQTFPDVAPGDTYYVYIERLAKRGLIGGFPDGLFRPNSPITRGQLSKIDANAASFSDTPPAGIQSFADVQPGDAYYLYVERLSRRGIIAGYACGVAAAGPCDSQNRPYFLPNTDVTRGQTSKIVSNTFFPIDCAPGRPQLRP